MVKRKREEKESEGPEFKERLGYRLQYGNLLNQLVSILVDAVSNSLDTMKKDLTNAYGRDVAMVSLYAENPSGVWSVGLKMMRATILSHLRGENKIEFPPSARAQIALILMSSARKPTLKLPSFTVSDVEVFK